MLDRWLKKLPSISKRRGQVGRKYPRISYVIFENKGEGEVSFWREDEIKRSRRNVS